MLAAPMPPLPFLSPVFSDHMVLQRDKANTFWGWSAPGDQVTVEIEGKKASGMAGTDGKWTVHLKPPKVGGPYKVIVSGASKAELNDVLVGDVWICSGQSNMQFSLGGSKNGPAEVATANEPNIRLFTVGRQVAYSPMPTLEGKWTVCTPVSVGTDTWNGFSAVGYYFGRKLQHELKVPIGLISTNWGGTSGEAWAARQGMASLGDFDAQLADVAASEKAGDPVFGTYLDRLLLRNDPGTPAHWESPDLDDSGWGTATVPNGLGGVPPKGHGTIWYRKTLDLASGDPGTLNLNQIAETDTVWINGQRVGSNTADWAWRIYPVPAGVLKPGRNVIAVRVFDPRRRAGFLGKPDQIFLDQGGKRTELAGEWKLEVGIETKDIPTKPYDTEPNPTVPTVLYNGMIAPLEPLAIRGAIWYQGETNWGRGMQYRRVLPALIADWRRGFGQGDFPFYIVGLANFQDRRPEPGDDFWPEVREAQALTAATVKNTGLATIIDVGEADDIHPKDKKTVGERLALNALALEYGQKIAYSGPIYKTMKITGDSIRLSFNHTDGGLIAKDGKLEGFAVAGEDRKWHWADARIEGDAVVVRSSEVPKPVAVRYAWATNPAASLYNGAGLPTVPFRTDDWPLLSANNR
ncbi:sialate O-acetylesterase [soil metagenome]